MIGLTLKINNNGVILPLRPQHPCVGLLFAHWGAGYAGWLRKILKLAHYPASGSYLTLKRYHAEFISTLQTYFSKQYFQFKNKKTVCTPYIDPVYYKPVFKRQAVYFISYPQSIP